MNIKKSVVKSLSSLIEATTSGAIPSSMAPSAPGAATSSATSPSPTTASVTAVVNSYSYILYHSGWYLFNTHSTTTQLN